MLLGATLLNITSASFTWVCSFTFHLWSFHPQDIMALVDCACRVYLHPPPASIALLICVLDSGDRNTVSIILCQQQDKQRKGLCTKQQCVISEGIDCQTKVNSCSIFHSNSQTYVGWMKYEK